MTPVMNLTKEYRLRDPALERYLFRQLMGLIVVTWVAAVCIKSLVVASLLGIALGVFIYPRLFSMFHDHAHGSFLEYNSWDGRILRGVVRTFMLIDYALWRTGHNRHHAEVGQFGIILSGAVGVIPLSRYVKLHPRMKRLYDVMRNSLFLIVFGYFSIFIVYFNLYPTFTSRLHRWNGIATLGCHFGMAVLVTYVIGSGFGIALVIAPILFGGMLGTLLFYLQHVFEAADYQISPGMSIEERVRKASSLLRTGPVAQWCTGSLGFHHVHHLNPLIPFYRLQEAYERVPELQTHREVRLNLKDIQAALDCFVWDDTNGRFIGRRRANQERLIFQRSLKA